MEAIFFIYKVVFVLQTLPKLNGLKIKFIIRAYHYLKTLHRVI
jgi:hypothetical protein